MAAILIIDDECSIRETLEIFLTKKGHQVYQAPNGSEGLALFSRYKPDIVILDIRLPDLNGVEVLKRIQQDQSQAKVIMVTSFQDMQTAIQTMQQGAYDYLRKPVDIDDMERVIDQALQVLEIEQDVHLLEDIDGTENLEAIIGKSEKMLEVFKTIGLLSQHRAPVLIQGETGTGKELTARMIHRNSPYHSEPFVTFDCSSVVETLLESELFGHEKGAFSGASRTTRGKIETAGKGTLFLDEVGELPPGLQKKLLGFLQRREFMRVGGNHALRARCRVITATNRDLSMMVQQRRFREDLYYRLKVVTLEIPPLRERSSDIPLLLTHFLHKINLELGTSVVKWQDGVMNRLMTHPWPGNVREFENTLVEAVVRARGKVILVKELEKILALRDGACAHKGRALSLSAMEKKHIEIVLAEVGWNKTEASRQLGITVPTLRSKIRKYGIVPPDSSD
ncbi:sigma-54-dependent Fis family transcriptional regulator [candidate division KSB3 bacterium]|uniref:DNA-binding transcriptional regulator NtrC n=1 Tax=candidate division KSB3 bacterium TaxID=2044937 RepID=A0A2G6EA05_9BACT|nr:MAG: sigma-54-dependent Fis family transcriptional regulator [candidate division KSB3 bacterium]PIE30972.1 MAG: sigma-54-dependent Fis family transcriptional regulator [candidate division KSB3 bacterium]